MNDDDLFQPTLQDHPGIVQRPSARPWRLGSQLWVAFFGGPLAVTAIATLNAQRLGMPRGRVRALFAVGASVSLAFLAALALWISPLLANGSVEADRSLLGFAGRGVALVLYGVLYVLQREADSLYRFNRDERDEVLYESLWIPGVIASAAAVGVVAGVTWAATR